MRREPEFFEERELDLVYIAKRLKEALRLESVLSEAGVDYAIETDTYVGGIIFRSERVGAFFYVAPESMEQVREVMHLHGFRIQQ